MFFLRRLPVTLIILWALLGCALVTDKAMPTVSPPDAEPLTDRLSLEEAAQIVLSEVVEPDSLGDRPIIVFAWPDLLRAGDTIQPYNKEGYGPSPDPTVIEQESYFFWLDDAPGAASTHPSRFVLVDQGSAALSVSEQSWWPVLNGQGLWVEKQAYWDETNWIFSNSVLRPEELSQSSKAPMVSSRLRPPIQGDSPGSAIIINGWSAGESLKEDFATSADQMHDSMTQFGFDTTYLGPPEDSNSDRDGEPTFTNRFNWFRQKATTMKPGQTLMVYVTGHGGVDESGGGGIGNVFESFLKDDLQRFAPGVNIVVILDSCHCGSFVDSLREVANVTITSTSQSKSAYGDIDGINQDKNSGDRGMEYTSGWVDGFRRIMLLPAENARVQQLADEQGGNFWATAAAEAHKAAVDKDLAAHRGWSEPQITISMAVTRTEPTPVPTATAPSPTPIPEPVSTAFFIDDPNDVELCESGEPLEDLEVDLTDFTLSLDSNKLIIQMNMDAPLVNDFSFAAAAYLIGEGDEVRAYLWETHDGALRIGEVDPQNLELLPDGSEDILIEHNQTLGQVVFTLPIDTLPGEIAQIGFQSVHMPGEGEERNCDSAGFYDLPPEFYNRQAQPDSVVFLDRRYDATLIVIEDESQHQQPVGMWDEGQLHIVSTFPYTMTIDGPAPWVNTTGAITEDGLFSTGGIGTVAGFPGIVVTFTGTIVGDDLSGRYAMGAQGGLPTGAPIVYQVEGILIPPLEPDTVVVTDTVELFVEEFNVAFANQDVDFLFDRLHPAVFDLYGAEQCQGYLEGVIDNLIQVELLATQPLGPWQYERDGRSIAVENAYAVEANILVSGQSSEQELHYALGDDGSLRWFTDCGDPLP